MLRGLLQVLRRAGFRVPLTVCAMLGSMFADAPSLADETGVSLPIYATPIGSHAANASDRGRATNIEPASHLTETRPALELARSNARFAMVELPPEATPGTAYKRPHHAFGYRSQAAESWMRDHGFEAQTCYLPMMRLLSRIGPAGASGTLWIYGRCTFK